MIVSVTRAAIAKMAACFVTVSCFLYMPAVFAQAEVVDPVPLGGSNSRDTYNASQRSKSPQQQSQGSSSQAQMTAEFYYQFQALQQEVMQLRGIVEEQAYELKKLKQQRLDDYLDLDRRISQLRGSGASTQSSGQTRPQASSQQAASARPAPADELKRYRAAIDLLLKQQNQEGAISALNEHLQDYPQGRYAANAQYWLGETWLLKGDLEQARKWFSELVKDFPGHNKVPDAKFKLGKVYDKLGDKVKARQLLEEVAKSGTSAAGLAKDYLQNKL